MRLVLLLIIVLPIFLFSQGEAIITYKDGTSSVEHIVKEKKKSIYVLSKKRTKNKQLWRSKIDHIEYTDSPKLELVNGIHTYQIVIDSIGMNDDEIFLALNSYVAEFYRSANDVIQLDDPINHILIGKGIWTAIYGHDFRLTFKMEVKKDRCRLTFSHFNLISSYDGEEVPIESDKWVQPERYYVALSRHLNDDVIPHLKEYIQQEKNDKW